MTQLGITIGCSIQV